MFNYTFIGNSKISFLIEIVAKVTLPIGVARFFEQS